MAFGFSSRTHGIDPGQVSDQCVGMPLNGSVFSVHRDAGEVSHVLIGSCEPVEQRGLSAVLVADKCESKQGVVGQRIAAAFRMELASFTQTGVNGSRMPPAL